MQTSTWTKAHVGDLATLVSGSTPSMKAAVYWGGTTPWVSAKDLKSMRVSRSQLGLTAQGRAEASLVPTGTVLVLVRGMSLFKGVPIGVADCELAINQDIKGLVPAQNVEPEFLAYSLMAREHQLLRSVEAAGHGTGRLDTDTLKELIIAVPPRPTQLRIVDVLNTWDLASEKLDALINAKLAARKALMQLLYNNGDHRLVRLSECVTRVTRKDTNGRGLPLTISGRDGIVNQLHFYDKRIAAEKTESYTLLKRGEFAYNRSYSNGYPYGAIKRLDNYDEGVLSSLSLCFALRENAPVLSDYLIGFCEAGGFNRQIHKIAQEGARNHGLLNVAADDFFAMKVPAPALSEQPRTVDVLASAQAEIRILQEEQNKRAAQKVALMRELLVYRRFERSEPDRGSND